MTKDEKHDRAVEDYLRENDPNFRVKSRTKGLEYPYHTHKQKKRRAAEEIPISCLSDSQKKSRGQVAKMLTAEDFN